MTEMTQLVAPPTTEAERATPPCPHFGPCGGCQLQHLTYEAQLARKADHLRALLASSIPNAPELEVHASEPLGYRNRIRLSLAYVAGELRAGYLRSTQPNSLDDSVLYATGTGPDEPASAGSLPATKGPSAKTTFLPITQCPIAAPILWRAAEALLAHAAEPDGFWLRDPRHTPDQLELFTDADESRLTFTLSLRTNSRTLPDRIVQAFAASCEHLRTQIPAISGAGLSLLPPASRSRSRKAEAARPGPVWGQPGLNYTIPLPTTGAETTSNGEHRAQHAQTLAYWVPRTAFFQVNRFLLPELLGAVLPAANASASHSLAWDLYAGTGLFSRPLAQSFASVTAVEIAEPAATALASSRLPNLHAVKATTLDFLRGAILQRERPDLVLLDPPRTGAGQEVCELLGRVAPPTLLYVSCSPSHLSSDLKTLTAAGYNVQALHFFDLFPQTTHIETLAVLTR
jgi:23S rRNA (uracil1939-C5)-methyltransferase